MMIPGRAPSTPASQAPCVFTFFAVLVLGRVLAEVPDVALGVLCVPVEGLLGDLAVDRDDVLDHRGRHAHHFRVRSVTVMTSTSRPSSVSPFSCDEDPGSEGKYGLSIRSTKSSGSISTSYALSEST